MKWEQKNQVYFEFKNTQHFFLYKKKKNKKKKIFFFFFPANSTATEGKEKKSKGATKKEKPSSPLKKVKPTKGKGKEALEPVVEEMQVVKELTEEEKKKESEQEKKKAEEDLLISLYNPNINSLHPSFLPLKNINGISLNAFPCYPLFHSLLPPFITNSAGDVLVCVFEVDQLPLLLSGLRVKWW
jgi:hypothetical protein